MVSIVLSKLVHKGHGEWWSAMATTRGPPSIWVDINALITYKNSSFIFQHSQETSSSKLPWGEFSSSNWTLCDSLKKAEQNVFRYATNSLSPCQGPCVWGLCNLRSYFCTPKQICHHLYAGNDAVTQRLWATSLYFHWRVSHSRDDILN